MCVAWLIGMCDMTTWLIYMCGMTHWYVWHDYFTSVTWLIRMRDMWLINMCEMTHSCVWHDSLVYSFHMQVVRQAICVNSMHVYTHIHIYESRMSHEWVTNESRMNALRMRQDICVNSTQMTFESIACMYISSSSRSSYVFEVRVMYSKRELCTRSESYVLEVRVMHPHPRETATKQTE